MSTPSEKHSVKDAIYKNGRLTPFPKRSQCESSGDFLDSPSYIFVPIRGEGVAEALERMKCEKLSHQRKYGRWTPDGIVMP